MRFRFITSVAVAVATLPLLHAAPASAMLEENLGALTPEQTEGYLGPFSSGSSGMLNSGIFRSGRIPKTGFNISLDLRASYIEFGDDSRTYTATTPGYETVEVPTAVGDTHAASAASETVAGLEMFYPGGFDMANFGIAVPQITIGNVLGTRAIVRFVSADVNDDIGTVKVFGIGGQHSISQYFSSFPVDVAVGAFFQNFDIGDVVNADAFNANVTTSKAFGEGVQLEPYVGLGLDTLKMNAKYQSGDEDIKVDFDKEQDFHLTLGTNLNFPVVTVNAEYNVAAVNGFAGGLSFGF